MVGEQMPVSVVTSAADAVRKAEVAVKAEYLEGGGHSELQILVDNGDGTTQPLQVHRQDFLCTQRGSCDFIYMVYYTMTMTVPIQDVNITCTHFFLCSPHLFCPFKHVVYISSVQKGCMSCCLWMHL